MLVRFADAFNDIRNSKLLSEQSIRTMLTHPPGAVGMSVRSTNVRARRCAVTPVVAHHVKVRRRKGGICPRSAPLRTLRARAFDRAWARRGVGEGVPKQEDW
jgi:hypothetical protein